MLRQLSTKLALLTSLFIAGSAQADVPIAGYIDYIPDMPAPPSPIPTMSEYLLVAMSLAMAFVAFHFLRNRTGNTLASILAGLSLIGWFSGASLIGNADAFPRTLTPIVLSEQSGGSAQFYCAGSAQPVSNTTSVAQKITAIRYTGGDVFPPTTNACAVGMVVPANTNSFCNINVEYG